MIFGLLAVWNPLAAVGGELRLTDGSVVRGDVASVNDSGVVMKLASGGFSERVPWVRLSQDTLKELVKDAKAAVFAEPYIEIPPEQKAEAKRLALEIKPVPREERPQGRITLFAAFTTPAGLMILLVLMAANLLAAYEVAVYRHQPVALVCAVSVFVPVLGPIIFLAMPPQEFAAHDAEGAGMSPEQFAASHPGAAGPGGAAGEPQAGLTSRLKSKITSMLQPSGGGLKVAAHKKPGAAGGAFEPKTFKRGETTFNRRFFETQFPGFFRVVPSEAEKDLVIVVKTRSEIVAKRISRITANEMGLQVLQGGEVMVAFAEIHEVRLCHKDQAVK
jgi:hypothetical protein